MALADVGRDGGSFLEGLLRKLCVFGKSDGDIGDEAAVESRSVKGRGSLGSRPFVQVPALGGDRLTAKELGRQVRRVLTSATRLLAFNWTMAALLVLTLVTIL